MKDCETCPLRENCLIMLEDEEPDCPCRKCLFKVTCTRYDPCIEFTDLVEEIKENITY
jgi:hypothetical protein